MSQRELFIDQNNLEENNFKSFVDAEYSREINKRRIIIKMGISRGELKKKKKTTYRVQISAKFGSSVHDDRRVHNLKW